MSASTVMYVNLYVQMTQFTWGRKFMKLIQTYVQNALGIMINRSVLSIVQSIVFHLIQIMWKAKMSSWKNIKY